MEKQKLMPALIGLGIGLAVLYITVRVISSGWSAGSGK